MSKADYIGIVHPWTYRQVLWAHRLKEGRYSYVWKAMSDQTFADWRGWGINGETHDL